MSRSARVEAIDVARGIGIILVVYGHVIRGLEVRHLVDGPWVRLHDQAVYAFHMPLFFFLSGLLIARGLDRDRLAFLKDKVPTLIYPYILWSVLQTVIVHVATPGSPTDVGIPALFDIWRLPVAEFWFLYALFVGQLTFVLLWRWKPAIILLALLSLSQISLHLPVGLNLGLSYFPYLVAGWIVGPYLSGERHSPALRHCAAAALVSGILFCTVFILQRTTDLGLPKQIVDPVLTFSGIGFVIALAWLIGGRFTLLSLLGKASMAIYVMHTIVVGAIRMLEVKLGMTEPIFMLVSLTIIGIAVPFFAYAFTSRVGISTACGFARDNKAIGAILPR